MGFLLAITLTILLAWTLSRFWRTERPAASLAEGEVERLLEALYRDGVRLGYKRAWAHQLEAEEQRVRTFVRRRTTTMLLACGAALVAASLPLLAALDLLPDQAAWLPELPSWQWLLLALAALVTFVTLGFVLRPQDYRGYFSTRTATAVELSRLRAELDELVAGRLAEQLDATKAYLTALNQERFEAGVAQGREAARLERRGLGGLIDEATLQTRVSSAANAAYVQGRDDGLAEARAEANQLAAEAYSRGVSDGERAAMAQVEARLRAERESAYRSGYRAGQAAAGADQAHAPRSAGGPGATARPRTRQEALAVLELPETASLAEVEQRFRELRASLHPDAFRARKLPTVMVRFAEEQFKVVGEAYDLLKR